MRLVTVREAKLAGARVNGDQLMIEVQVSHGNKLVQIGYESTLAGIAEMRDVVNGRG